MKNLTTINGQINNNKGLFYSFTYKDICNGVDIDTDVNNNEGMMTTMNNKTMNKIMNEIMEEVNKELQAEAKEAVEEAANEILAKQDAIKIARIRNRLYRRDFSFNVYNRINNLKLRVDEEKEELKEEYFKGLKKNFITSFKNQKVLEKATKEIPNCTIKQIYIDLDKDENNIINKTVIVQNQVVQESELLIAAGTEEMQIGDSNMFIKGKGTYKICSLSLGNTILNTQDSYARTKLEQLFGLICKRDNSVSGIYLIVNEAGNSRIEFNEYDLNLKDDEIAYKYLFLGITPSGLRSGSLSLAAVKEYYSDGSIVECDNRIEILDKASDGAFKKTFLDSDGNFVKTERYSDFFKQNMRILLSSTASVRLGKVETSIIFKDIAEGAGYSKSNELAVSSKNVADFVDCEDTQDGATFTSVLLLKNWCLLNNVPFDRNTFLGVCNQTRGGGTKDSTRFVSQRLMKILILNAISKGNKILKIVFRGQETSIEALKANNQFDIFCKEVQHIGDKNSMKLLEHEAAWNIVSLKKAHASDTCLNMVINIAMLFQDQDAAKDLLMEYGKEAIMEKFEQFGFEFSFDEDGDLENFVFCPQNIQCINNDSQLINHYYKNNPELTLAIMSSLLKSALNNEVKSIRKLINTLRIEVEAKYMVVQSDIAPLFGFRLLKDNEVFSNEFKGVKRVSAARHPISGIHAISTFNVIGIETIIERLNKVEKLSDEIKDEIIEHYLSSKEFVIIPASHYLMEKHDGMDFDIDSMQFFTDKKVVNILSKIEELGTKINRDADKDKNISEKKSVKEEIISEFQKDSSKNIVDKLIAKIDAENKQEVKVLDTDDDSNKVAFKIKSTKSTLKTNSNAKCVQNIDGTYTASFDNIAKMVLDYFLNPVDPIGFMATDFYNNALLYILMNSKSTSIRTKEFIARCFKKAFKCKNNGSYVSPIKKNPVNGRTEVILDKESATNTIFRFANSNGSIEDLTAFLYDACICNRYPAETSIDAAKNNYAVINMFSFRFIIKALGSDKTMSTKMYGNEVSGIKYDEEMATSDALYNDLLNQLKGGLIKGQYSSGNFFNIGLLYSSIGEKDYEVNKLLKDESIEIEDCILPGRTPCVLDPLAEVRKYLTRFANTLIVVATKELESFITSDRCVEIRNEYKEMYTGSFSEKDSYFNTANVLNSAVKAYMTLSDGLREVDEINEATNEETFKAVHSKEYKKTIALQGCRNFAKLSLKASKESITDEQIGCAAIYLMIESFEKSLEDGKCKSLNTSILTMFEKEINAFLESQGVETEVGEAILCASKNNRQFSLEKLIEKEIHVVNGKSSTMIDDEEILIDMRNKKANISGLIKKIEDKFYVISEKQYLEENEKAGIFVSVKMNNNVATCDYINKHDSIYNMVDVRFEKNYTDYIDFERNVLVGTDSNNEEIAIASLFTNTYVSNLLAKMDLDLKHINIIKGEKGICIHLNQNDFIEELSFVDTIEDTSDFGFDMNDVFMDGVAMVEDDSTTTEVAVDTEYNLQNMFGDIVLPQ